MHNRLSYSIPVAIVVIVAFVYWPVVHAAFVLDDVIDFVDMKWLSHGDDWKHYIFRDFNYWTNYFRPLVLAFFTLQVRLFNDTPGPMHAVSLGMHLINTLLVGLLAWRCSVVPSGDSTRRTIWLAAAMLLYGLHPVLIEPVTWIGCQFDLAATLFMLLGLLANTYIRDRRPRAIVVAGIFFLAACSKESAVTFPLMLGIFDWALLTKSRSEEECSAAKAFVHRNWLTYVAIVVAGLIYLAFRYWALGQIIHPVENNSLPWLGHFQEICYLYMRYWGMLFWPTYGMNPIHEYATQQFMQISTASLITDAAAVVTVAGSAYFAIKRASPLACLVAMVTCGLLPVLHIISTSFEPSLYHERYVMTSLACICAMIPLIRLPASVNPHIGLIRPLAVVVGCLWLIFAAVDIRTTIRWWSDSTNLWRWVLVENPNSIDAKNNLLIAYIENRDSVNARPLIDRLLNDHTPCANCMLNAAIFAISEQNPTLAARALDEARNIPEIAEDKQIYHRYLLATGQMLVLQGNLQDAEAIFRNAVTQSPEDPKPRLELAKTLALQGKATEAEQMGESGLELLPPDRREAAHAALIQAITGTASHPK